MTEDDSAPSGRQPDPFWTTSELFKKIGVPQPTSGLDAAAEKFEQQKLVANHEAAQARNAQEMAERRADQAQREQYAHASFVLVAVWSVVCVALVVLDGLPDDNRWHLSIDQPVLIALVTGAFVNVLGLFGIVLHGLFGPEARSNRSARGKRTTKS